MKILMISALFPPEAHGGAEDSAWNQAQWLRKQGHDVHVVATAQSSETSFENKEIEGLHTWRVYTPRPYPVFQFTKAKSWLKPLWHFQDYFDPRNQMILRKVLNKIQPEVILIHFVPGLGYNALKELAKKDIPTVFFLHDLGLACMKMNMYNKGKNCSQLCPLCKLTAKYKHNIISQFKRIGFCAPSFNHLNKLASFFPLDGFPQTSILNTNKYPLPTFPSANPKVPHFIFVGRIHFTKGIDIFLKAAASIAKKKEFKVTVIGDGPDLENLQKAYGNKKWCQFTGRLTQQEIANHMATGTALCVPSVTWENSPGVAIHALLTGLPVLGSHTGGIPELVKDGENGQLVPLGDIDAWAKAMENVIDNPDKVTAWKDFAQKDSKRFEQDYIGNQTLKFIEKVKQG